MKHKTDKRLIVTLGALVLVIGAMFAYQDNTRVPLLHPSSMSNIEPAAGQPTPDVTETTPETAKNTPETDKAKKDRNNSF